MQHRTVVLAAISLFLLGWGGINLGGGVPDAGGSGTFCDADAPTNIYCQDFEVVGSNCTLEDPAMNENSADCGYTTTILSDSESMEVSGTEVQTDQASYTHSNGSCHSFCYRPTASFGPASLEPYRALDGSGDTYPLLIRSSGSGNMWMECDGSTSTSVTTAAVGTSYWIEMGYLNSKEEGTFFVNDVEIGTCDGGQAGSPNDNGWKSASGTSNSHLIDNVHITTDVTCAATMPTGACDPL